MKQNNLERNDIFNRVCQWNKVRDNTNFSFKTEFYMLAEELLEFSSLSKTQCKEIALNMTNEATKYYDLISEVQNKEIVKESMADALGDLIFIAIGSLYKLGYDPTEVLATICDHNDQKGSKKDEKGKIIKDKNFIEPEHKNANL